MPSTRTAFVVVSASIGAGHDAAAAEITRQLRSSGATVDRVDFLDLLPAGWGRTVKQTYARQLAHAPASWGWLLDAMGGPRATRSAAWLSERAASAGLSAAIPPGTTGVISTYPLASQALGRLRPAVPTVAVLTDPAVHPLCVAPGVGLHLAPNEDAAAQVRTRSGLPVASAAPIVGPSFRPGDRLAARRVFGLPPVAQLALVVAGSGGVGDIGTTVRDLSVATDVIPVVVCGHNTTLRDRLAAGGRAIALGWIDDMPSLLRPRRRQRRRLRARRAVGVATTVRGTPTRPSRRPRRQPAADPAGWPRRRGFVLPRQSFLTVARRPGRLRPGQRSGTAASAEASIRVRGIAGQAIRIEGLIR